jgi:hypothetical protein
MRNTVTPEPLQIRCSAADGGTSSDSRRNPGGGETAVGFAGVKRTGVTPCAAAGETHAAGVQCIMCGMRQGVAVHGAASRAGVGGVPTHIGEPNILRPPCPTQGARTLTLT